MRRLTLTGFHAYQSMESGAHTGQVLLIVR
jgi:hypothetical protein